MYFTGRRMWLDYELYKKKRKRKKAIKKENTERNIKVVLQNEQWEEEM